MASQTNSIEKVNATVQGTGVNREKSSEDYVPDIVVDDVSYSDNLFEDFSPTVAGESQDFESMIHCCDRIPYIDRTGGIESVNTVPIFPTYSTCVDKYEYIHPCGCPQVFLWEYHQGSNLMRVYFEAEGESNFKAHGTPNKHPDHNGSNAATDAMFGQSGASGFWSLGSPADSDNSNGSSYALVCVNLHKGCEYLVCVVFTMEDADTNGGSTFHGGAHLLRFKADSCVQYLGGDKDGNHAGQDPHPRSFPDDGSGSTQLIDFPDAFGGDDAYANIKGLHIQMTGVPKGRGQSDESFQQNDTDAGC